MAIFNFQKPDKVIMIDSTDFEGKFEFRPLEPGYGLTVGNALRRVLLSSLEGYAITSVRIEGVEHEFSTIAGVVEDVTEIILNLKQVRFKRQIEDIDNESVSISLSGKDKITAGDFQKFISGFQVLNPDLVICNLDSKTAINMELSIEKGRGYVPAEENKKSNPLKTFLTIAISLAIAAFFMWLAVRGLEFKKIAGYFAKANYLWVFIAAVFGLLAYKTIQNTGGLGSWFLPLTMGLFIIPMTYFVVKSFMIKS